MKCFVLSLVTVVMYSTSLAELNSPAYLAVGLSRYSENIETATGVGPGLHVAIGGKLLNRVVGFELTLDRAPTLDPELLIEDIQSSLSWAIHDYTIETTNNTHFSVLGTLNYSVHKNLDFTFKTGYTFTWIENRIQYAYGIRDYFTFEQEHITEEKNHSFNVSIGLIYTPSNFNQSFELGISDFNDELSLNASLRWWL